jgi:hypothetical protein
VSGFDATTPVTFRMRDILSAVWYVIICDRAVDDMMMLDRPPVGLEYTEALDKTIVLRGQIDTLLNSAVSRRNNDLRLIELYREGQRRHQASDEIVDAEFKDATPQVSQVEAPLVPLAGGTQ